MTSTVQIPLSKLIQAPQTLALLKAQISLQLGKVFSSDNGVSVLVHVLTIQLRKS